MEPAWRLGPAGWDLTVWLADCCRAQALAWHVLNGTGQSTGEYAVPSKGTPAPGNRLNQSWPPLTFTWLRTNCLRAHSLKFLTCLLNSCEEAGFKYIIYTQDLECKDFMVWKAILSPQLSLTLLPRLLLHSILPLVNMVSSHSWISSCLPFLGGRESCGKISHCCPNWPGTLYVHNQSLKIHSNPLAPASTVLTFQAGTMAGLCLCFNHTLTLLQWSKKSVTEDWGIFGFCASRFIAWAFTSSPSAQFIFIAFYIFFLLFCVTGISYIHI